MDKTYRRSQVEWALWKFATLDRPSGDEAISTFRARVKHLLLLDRTRAMFSKARRAPKVAHALSSHETEGTGVDAIFTAFDTFCLALALDFMRAGFKQSEVLLLIAHLRPRLAQPFAAIMRSPPRFRSRHSPKTGAGRSTMEPEEDRRVFLVVERVEFAEAFPTAAGRKVDQGAIFREPTFCHGIDGLRDKLDAMDHFFRRAVVMEIANMAARVSEFLDQAPLVRRGRRPGTI
jgi:hypothetical protein